MNSVLIGNARLVKHSVSTTRVTGQMAWHDKPLNDSCQDLPLRFMR